MSHDGHQTIRIAVVDHGRDDVARALAAKPLTSISFAFGFGETHPVRPDDLDAVVKLPWEPIDTGDIEEELGDVEEDFDESFALEDVQAIRFIEKPDDALEAIGELVKKVASLRKRIERALGGRPVDDADVLREVLAADATPADAVSDSQRIAYVVACIARALRKAKAKESALVVAFLER